MPRGIDQGVDGGRGSVSARIGNVQEASAWLEVGGRQEISGEGSGASAAVLELILRAEAARKEARESAVQALRDALG